MHEAKEGTGHQALGNSKDTRPSRTSRRVSTVAPGERSRYGFDRLASRVVREARQGFGRRRDALQRLRAFAVGLGLGVLGLAALGAAGIIGPKVEAPQRLWLNTGTESKTHGRAACGDSTVAPDDTIEEDGFLFCTGVPVGYPAGARFSIADNPGEGDPSAQGAVLATLHKAIARPRYLGGEAADRLPQNASAPRARRMVFPRFPIRRAHAH